MSGDQVLTVGADIIAITFLWSGVAKLLQLDGAEGAVRRFGVTKAPRYVAGAVAVAEIAIGGVLVSRGVMVGALAASSLLAIFTAVSARSVLRGERFACFCFGDSAEVLSWRGVLRTAALLSGAASVATASILGVHPVNRTQDTFLAAVLALAAVGVAASAAAGIRLVHSQTKEASA